MDIEETVSKYEKDSKSDPSSQIENPFLEHMKSIDVVINAVGASKTKDIEHSRIIDLETNRLLIDAAK
jgi:hypothetical protein